MNGKKECGFVNEMVSYIYDEMDAPGRRRFEAHLSSCTACTDEFAAISDARFSVFEWHREEFAHLPTPEIVIPYSRNSKALSDVTSPWLGGFAEMFAFIRSPLTAVAGIAVVIGLGLVLFLGTRTGDEKLVAANSAVPSLALPEQPTVAVVGSDVVAPQVNSPFSVPKAEVTQAKVAERRSRPMRSASGSDGRRSNGSVASQISVRRQGKAPVLSDLGDDEDDSLRLSDLLDGIGG